jgi:antitoxin component YwqK of YwqJK toxin-antitoxin module
VIVSCTQNNKQPNHNLSLNEGKVYEIVIRPNDAINSGERITIGVKLNSSILNNLQFTPKWVYFGDTTEITKRQNKFEMFEVIEIPTDSVLIRKIPTTIILGYNQNEIFQDTITYSISNIENSARTSGRLINNQKNGVWKFYYDDEKTKIKEISTWENNVKNGKTEYYYENGKLNRSGLYKYGQLDGEWRIFGTSGKLNYIDVYENGKFIEQKKLDKKRQAIIPSNHAQLHALLHLETSWS